MHEPQWDLSWADQAFQWSEWLHKCRAVHNQATLHSGTLSIPHLIVRCNLNLTFTIQFTHCTAVFTGNTMKICNAWGKKITKSKLVTCSETQRTPFLMMLPSVQTKITDGKCLSGQFFWTYCDAFTKTLWLQISALNDGSHYSVVKSADKPWCFSYFMLVLEIPKEPKFMGQRFMGHK